MTDQNPAALGRIIADCRAQMEHDLCELFDELGPVLAQMAVARADTGHVRRERIAATALNQALPSIWEKVGQSLRDALSTRQVDPAKSLYDAAAQPAIRLLSREEETVRLAMREVLERVALACRDETRALERRINFLVLRRILPPGDSTFRFSALWPCIETACAKFVSDTDTLVLLLELIGEQMAAEMPQLYRVVNEVMIEAGILPRLKRSYRDLIPVDAQEVAEESARVADALDRLVKARTTASDTSRAPGTDAATGALLKSLQTLQTTAPPVSPGKHANVVRMARESGAASDIRPLEALTLDIVAKLFDLIFSDPKVAEDIKALVARLQTTVLRAAMLNQRFFADRSHPARRFLDSISAVAVRWGRVVNVEDPFFLKLSELVDKVHNAYDDDMAVFVAANAELDAFLVEREKLEEQQNHALAEAVRAREEEMRLKREAQLRTQKLADACITRVLEASAPIEIEAFLRSYWRDVVQTRIAQFGEDGAGTAEALQVASDLQHSVSPEHASADQQLQTASLPALLKRLNTGLDEIGAAPTERKAFMDTLIELQLAALRTKRQVADKALASARLHARNGGPTLQVSHALDSGVRVQDISLPADQGLDEEDTPHRSDLRRVRQLVRGDWLDFITAGQTRRERLTWINRSRTLFLFTNSASDYALSITPEALAVRLKNGSARLVKPDQPIFERAIHGAIKALDQRI